MEHHSDPPDKISSSQKKNKSRNRQKQPSVIFYSREITLDTIASAVNRIFKRKVRILGARQLNTGKVIVWTHQASLLNQQNWTEILNNGHQVWTHIGGQHKIPTIGYVANIAANISPALIKSKTGATGAVRIGRGFKLYFPTPKHLYCSLMDGFVANGSYRQVDIWIPSSRCSICGGDDHFHKNCTNEGQCMVCSESHSFRDCPAKMELVREERKIKLTESWQHLENWIEENDELEDLTSSTVQQEEKEKPRKPRRLDRPTVSPSNPDPFFNAWNNRQQSNRHRAERKESDTSSDCISVAKQLVRALKDNLSEDPQMTMDMLLELQKKQERRHEIEKEFMKSLIEEAKSIEIAKAHLTAISQPKMDNSGERQPKRYHPDDSNFNTKQFRHESNEGNKTNVSTQDVINEVPTATSLRDDELSKLLSIEEETKIFESEVSQVELQIQQESMSIMNTKYQLEQNNTDYHTDSDSDYVPTVHDPDDDTFDPAQDYDDFVDEQTAHLREYPSSSEDDGSS